VEEESNLFYRPPLNNGHLPTMASLSLTKSNLKTILIEKLLQSGHLCKPPTILGSQGWPLQTGTKSTKNSSELSVKFTYHNLQVTVKPVCNDHLLDIGGRYVEGFQ
jgi:hypothetical protein